MPWIVRIQERWESGPGLLADTLPIMQGERKRLPIMQRTRRFFLVFVSGRRLHFPANFICTRFESASRTFSSGVGINLCLRAWWGRRKMEKDRSASGTRQEKHARMSPAKPASLKLIFRARQASQNQDGCAFITNLICALKYSLVKLEHLSTKREELLRLLN